MLIGRTISGSSFLTFPTRRRRFLAPLLIPVLIPYELPDVFNRGEFGVFGCRAMMVILAGETAGRSLAETRGHVTRLANN